LTAAAGCCVPSSAWGCPSGDTSRLLPAYATVPKIRADDPRECCTLKIWHRTMVLRLCASVCAVRKSRLYKVYRDALWALPQASCGLLRIEKCPTPAIFRIPVPGPSQATLCTQRRYNQEVKLPPQSETVCVCALLFSHQAYTTLGQGQYTLRAFTPSLSLDYFSRSLASSHTAPTSHSPALLPMCSDK